MPVKQMRFAVFDSPFPIGLAHLRQVLYRIPRWWVAVFGDCFNRCDRLAVVMPGSKCDLAFSIYRCSLARLTSARYSLFSSRLARPPSVPGNLAPSVHPRFDQAGGLQLPLSNANCHFQFEPLNCPKKLLLSLQRAIALSGLCQRPHLLLFWGRGNTGEGIRLY